LNDFLEGLESLNFKNKSNKVTSFIDPFFVCEIKDFLTPRLYNDLAQTFPSVELFDQGDKGGKKAVDLRSEVSRNFILKTPVWKDFINSINNHKTSIILKKYLEESLPERDDFKNREWLTEVDFYNPNKELNKNLSKLDVNLIRYSFEFSHLPRGSYIPPHTDSITKVISMILYFPDHELIGSEYQNGTYFLKPHQQGITLSTHNSVHLRGDDLKCFRRNYEVLHYAEFVPNKFVLFIKNDVSWHEVRKQIQPEQYTRKAFIINVYCG
jgi:hypothetical protein